MATFILNRKLFAFNEDSFKAMLSNVNDENIHKAYSYEVADYIQKPFQEPVVKRRVESIIELFEKKKQMKAKGSP